MSSDDQVCWLETRSGMSSVHVPVTVSEVHAARIQWLSSSASCSNAEACMPTEPGETSRIKHCIYERHLFEASDQATITDLGP